MSPSERPPPNVHYHCHDNCTTAHHSTLTGGCFRIANFKLYNWTSCHAAQRECPRKTRSTQLAPSPPLIL